MKVRVITHGVHDESGAPEHEVAVYAGARKRIVHYADSETEPMDDGHAETHLPAPDVVREPAAKTVHGIDVKGVEPL